VGIWTVVQWQDTFGDWHDVEGWQRTPDDGYQKTWWVAAKDLGTGPFRRAVNRIQSGRLLITSESFYLPEIPGQRVTVEVSF
jgi:hypothetical protein